MKTEANLRYSGDMLVNEVADILALWVARGMTMAVLEAIRNQVYAIPAPAAP